MFSFWKPYKGCCKSVLIISVKAASVVWTCKTRQRAYIVKIHDGVTVDKTLKRSVEWVSKVSERRIWSGIRCHKSIKCRWSDALVTAITERERETLRYVSSGLQKLKHTFKPHTNNQRQYMQTIIYRLQMHIMRENSAGMQNELNKYILCWSVHEIYLYPSSRVFPTRTRTLTHTHP